jgi:hypothetical protein
LCFAGWPRLVLAAIPALVLTLVPVTALTLAATEAAAQSRPQDRSGQMYRYTNAEGVKVIAYQVPPEFVAGGYEVLSSTGAVVSVVPRQLGAEELQALNARERLERDVKAEQERLRKWDESLLLRYSTIDDIEAARERSLRDLRIRVSILKGKLRSLKQQVESYQALAADQERFGKTVDVEHLTAMENLRAEIRSTERAVNDRMAEISAVDASYDADVQRFASLTDIVEMRRIMAQQDNQDER